MDALQKRRLQWQCRRGLLELDLILERFLKKDPKPEGLAELLTLPDNDLWDIVIGRSNSFAPHLNQIVSRLRAA